MIHVARRDLANLNTCYKNCIAHLAMMSFSFMPAEASKDPKDADNVLKAFIAVCFC